VTSVTTQPTVAFGNPNRVPRPFALTSATLPGRHDVMPDGRFLGLLAPGQAGTSQPEIRVVLNWFAALKRLVPAKQGRACRARDPVASLDRWPGTKSYYFHGTD